MKEYKEDPENRLDEYQKELENPSLVNEMVDRTKHMYDRGYLSGAFYSSAENLSLKEKRFRLHIIVLGTVIILSVSSFFISENPWLWSGLFFLLFILYLRVMNVRR